MMMKWVSAWCVGAAALLSGCKHSSQPFLPKKCGPCESACTTTVKECGDCSSSHEVKRYFTPVPNACKSAACAPVLPTDDAKSTNLPAIPTGSGGKILPDDMPPVKPAKPAQLPDAGYHDVKIETPQPPVTQDVIVTPPQPPVAQDVIVTPPQPPVAQNLIVEPAQPPVAQDLIAEPPALPVTIPDAPAPATPVAPVVQPIEARSADYTRLNGKLEYSNIKRQWRLRYAAPDSDDEFGGVVTLMGLDNLATAPTEGAAVQIKGQLVRPDGKTGSPEYYVHEMTRLETP